jgi:lysophospholipase L1-like esterase
MDDANRLRSTRHAVLLVALSSAIAIALGGDGVAGQAAQRNGQHWVSTWATALQLTPPVARGGGPPPAPPPSQTVRPASLPAGGQRGGYRPVPSNIPASLADQTIRMVARTSLGGSRIRISLSNMLNGQPVRIGSAHLALHAGGGQIVRGTDRALTFGGGTGATIPPGALLLSDPVDLTVAPLADLAVSLYLPVETGAPTTHSLGLRTAYISRGDVTASESMPDPATTLGYLWLSAVDVLAPGAASTVVAFGDSITDGYGTTLDANQAWPTLLARRLAGERTTRHLAVVNQGISGNQVLRNGAGLSALARFDRDVLSRSGVKWVIWLEGINDINIRGRADGVDALTAEELIGGYQQLIARAHSHGLRVLGATLTPQEGVPTATQRGEAIRQTANQWIRTSRAFDAVVDFDAVLRDPARPIRLLPAFDPGDHIHPNDAGNRVMADAFDLKVFVK